MANSPKWAYPLTALVLGIQAVQPAAALAQDPEAKFQVLASSAVVSVPPAAADPESPSVLLTVAPDALNPAIDDLPGQPSALPIAVTPRVPSLTSLGSLDSLSADVVPTVAADATATALGVGLGAEAAIAVPSAWAESSVTVPLIAEGLDPKLSSSPIAAPTDEASLPALGLALDPDGETPYTPIDQLHNIEAQHWAAQAVKQLGDRYECYTTSDPFATKAVLTRYEFASYLEPCLDAINDRIASETEGHASREDLAVMQRLQDEFAAELATLTGRIDGVEDRIQTLEANRFSEHTKLFGVASFLLSSAQGNNGQNYGPRYQSTVILDFDTRFTGSDLLRTEIRASNMNFIRAAEVTGTGMSLLNVVPESDSTFLHITGGGDPPTDQPDFELSTVFYQIRFAQKGLLRFGTHGITSDSLIPDMSIIPSASLYGVRSPIYRNSVGAGAVVFYQFNDLVSWGASYLAKNPDFTQYRGIFEGRYGALTQVTLTPSPKLGIGLTYGRHYSDGRPIWAGTGSGNAGQPYGFIAPASDREEGDLNPNFNHVPASVNDLGLQVRYQATKQLTLGGWFGYSFLNAEGTSLPGGDGAQKGDDAQVMYWAAGLKVQDLGRRGNQLGFLVGMPPKVLSNDTPGREDTGTSYHVELTYRHRINNRVYLQPGVYMVTNPDHNPSNETLWMTTLNTLFIF